MTEDELKIYQKGKNDGIKRLSEQIQDILAECYQETGKETDTRKIAVKIVNYLTKIDKLTSKY